MAPLAVGEGTTTKEAFRRVMAHFATGVAVVTTRSAGGEVAGLTINSFTSVSLDPPLVLFCVDVGSVTLPSFRANGTFAVNVLASEQEALARCFATSSQERYAHFCPASYRRGATGSPLLDGALAFIEARIAAEYPGGDHAIFLGRVVALGTDAGAPGELDGWSADAPGAERDTSPLVFYGAHYRQLAGER